MKDLKQIEDTLPIKLSELIRLAIKDLNKVEKMPDYVVDMGAWHSEHFLYSNICKVCLAGSVMACELKLEHGRLATPYYFNQSLSYKLNALNEVRKYNISNALGYLNVNEYSENLESYNRIEKDINSKILMLRHKTKAYTPTLLEEYNENKVVFKLNMLYIAKELKKLNL